MNEYFEAITRHLAKIIYNIWGSAELKTQYIE
jgi:hypothetical protein